MYFAVGFLIGIVAFFVFFFISVKEFRAYNKRTKYEEFSNIGIFISSVGIGLAGGGLSIPAWPATILACIGYILFETVLSDKEDIDD